MGSPPPLDLLSSFSPRGGLDQANAQLVHRAHSLTHLDTRRSGCLRFFCTASGSPGHSAHCFCRCWLLLRARLGGCVVEWPQSSVMPKTCICLCHSFHLCHSIGLCYSSGFRPSSVAITVAVLMLFCRRPSTRPWALLGLDRNLLAARLIAMMTKHSQPSGCTQNSPLVLHRPRSDSSSMMAFLPP